MDIKDYIRILVKGFREHREHLTKYIIRESERAKSQGVDAEEFFYNLNDIIHCFFDDIDCQVAEENYNHSIIKQIRIENGKQIEDLVPRSKEMFSCHLPRVSDNDLTGNLWYTEIQFIENAINKAKPLSLKGDNAYRIYDLNTQEQIKHNYERLKSDIKETGILAIQRDSGKWIKVYNPELAVIFMSKKILVRDIILDVDLEINGDDYYFTYKEAFEEGERYFDKEIKAPKSVIYGENAGQYIQDLQNSYFRKLINNKYQGWKFVKNSFHNRLTHNEIKGWGYYSGIVSKLLDYVKEHPASFKDFENADIKTASKKEIIISETDQYIIDLNKIHKSYNQFNNDLFEMNYPDYVGCFNLSNQTPKHPEFKSRQEIKFIYFLSQIKDVDKMDSKALERFGLKNYKNRKRKAKPDAVFINRVVTILK